MSTWLANARQEIDMAVEGMKPEDFLRAPAGKWNTAQILEHLGRAFGSTAKMLELQLEAGAAPQIPSRTWKQRLAVFVVVTLGHLPRGYSAPPGTLPEGLDGLTAFMKLREALKRMDRALAEAESRWGKGRIAVHPILGPLTAAQWRKFHFVHARHHMKQVRERRNAPIARGEAEGVKNVHQS